jgi:hypothetical protein
MDEHRAAQRHRVFKAGSIQLSIGRKLKRTVGAITRRLMVIRRATGVKVRDRRPR